MSGLKKFMNLYEFSTELPGTDETIEYKGLTTNSLKKLLMYEHENDPLMMENIIDKIIEISLKEKPKLDDWYVADRHYMFIKIKEATSGSEFQNTYKCKKCKNENIFTIDLSKLIVKKPDKVDPVVKVMNDEIIFTLDYPKRKSQKELYKLINKKLSNSEKQIEVSLVNLASMITDIKTPDGKIKIDPKELIQFLGELKESDLKVFRDWEDSFGFGLRMKQDSTCRYCKESENVDIPISVFF